MADINVTRRKKLLAYLHENGGVMAIGQLHDWSGLKLLAAHQAFSQLMEGLTADGLVAWDGTIFTLTADGKAAVEAAGKEKPRGRKKKEADEEPAEDVVPAPAPAPVVPAPAPVVAEAALVAEPAAAPVAAEPAPAAAPAEDGHDHGHSHGHSHGGAREERPPVPPRTTPRKAAPPPPPPKVTVGSFAKAILRRLLGMEK